MRTTKRERFAEMRRILERVCDADMATKGDTDTLRERMTIATAVDAQEAMQPRQRKGKASTERSRRVTPKYEVIE